MLIHSFYTIYSMVKKFMKTNNNFLWAGAVIGIVVLFLYVGGVREGFQTAPSVRTGLPTVIPSSKDSNMMLPMPQMNTSTPTIPNSNTMSSMSQMNTPEPVMPNPKPSIAVVRNKLNELKTMVDNM